MTTNPTLFLASQQANTTDSGTTDNDQYDQQIVALTDGTFVVLWTSNTDDGAGAPNSTDIIGQRYDAEGSMMGVEFRANYNWSMDTEGNFTAKALPDGKFVIAYEDTNVDGTSIRYDVLNADGTHVPGGNGSIYNDTAVLTPTVGGLP
jgi:hypothetical protein